MAAELETLGKKFGQNGHRVIGGLLRLEGRIAKWLGVPKSFSENGNKPEKINLETEWNRQAQNAARLFAKELGFKTPGEYIATLPKFEPQPKEWKGRFDIPVIVEIRVPLKRMLELSGIATYFNIDSIKDWEKSKFQAPEKPYTTYLNDGNINLNKSVDQVRKSLRIDERGGNIFDGIALYLKDPKILEHHFLDLPGSQVGSGNAPDLNRWLGRPELGRRFVDFANPRDGSVVAGSAIRT